jgi:hypothetical protein
MIASIDRIAHLEAGVDSATRNLEKLALDLKRFSAL